MLRYIERIEKSQHFRARHYVPDGAPTVVAPALHRKQAKGITSRLSLELAQTATTDPG